jgi:hypothetical protein
MGPGGAAVQSLDAPAPVCSLCPLFPVGAAGSAGAVGPALGVETVEAAVAVAQLAPEGDHRALLLQRGVPASRTGRKRPSQLESSP